MAKTVVLRPKKRASKTRQVRRLFPALPRLQMDAIGYATLNGSKMSARLSESVVDLERDLTILGANVLTLKTFDPDHDLLRADLLGGQLDLGLGAAGRWRMDRSRDVGGLSVTGDFLTLRLWCIGSAALRGQTDPQRVSADRVDIGGWAKTLAGEVERDVHLQVVAPYPGEVPPAEHTTGTGTSKASRAGFSSKERLKGKVDDSGASNYLSAGELRNAARVLEVARKERAPERATIALLTACMVEGPDFRNSSVMTDSTSVGILQLLDLHGSTSSRMDIENVCRLFLRKGFTGQGGAIDLARKHPTWSAGQVSQYVQGSAHPGRYAKSEAHAQKILEAWRGGESSGSGSSAESRPAQWRRGTARERESSWTALEREAKRLGRRRFIALPWLQTPRLVVAADQQLIRAQPHLTISAFDDRVLTEAPRIDLEGIAHLQTIELTVLSSAWNAPPGGAVEMVDCGPADGPWEVQRLISNAGTDTARVTLQQPTTKVEAQPDRTTASGKGRSASGGSVADRLWRECQKISDKSLPYGTGGHGQPWDRAKNAPTMDCSSSTSVALHAVDRMGGASGPQVSDWFLNWGKPGRGDGFTVWVKPGSGDNGHVFIGGEGKHAGKRFDTGYVDKLGRGPRVRKTPRSNAGMQPRHWPGN